MATVEMITQKQIQRLQIMKKIIECNDEQWYTALYELYSVLSTKDLTKKQADQLIEALRNRAINYGFVKEPDTEKNRHLDARPGFATAKQLDFIESLWFEITRDKTEKERVKGLRNFLLKQVKVSDIRFLKTEDASKVIFVLKKLKESNPAKGEHKVSKAI